MRLLIKIIDQSERRFKEDSKEPYVKGNLKEATFKGGSMELHGTLLRYRFFRVTGVFR